MITVAALLEPLRLHQLRQVPLGSLTRSETDGVAHMNRHV